MGLTPFSLNKTRLLVVSDEVVQISLFSNNSSTIPDYDDSPRLKDEIKNLIIAFVRLRDDDQIVDGEGFYLLCKKRDWKIGNRYIFMKNGRRLKAHRYKYNFTLEISTDQRNSRTNALNAGKSKGVRRNPKLIVREIFFNSDNNDYNFTSEDDDNRKEGAPSRINLDTTENACESIVTEGSARKLPREEMEEVISSSRHNIQVLQENQTNNESEDRDSLTPLSIGKSIKIPSRTHIDTSPSSSPLSTSRMSVEPFMETSQSRMFSEPPIETFTEPSMETLPLSVMATSICSKESSPSLAVETSTTIDRRSSCVIEVEHENLIIFSGNEDVEQSISTNVFSENVEQSTSTSVVPENEGNEGDRLTLTSVFLENEDAEPSTSTNAFPEDVEQSTSTSAVPEDEGNRLTLTSVVLGSEDAELSTSTDVLISVERACNPQLTEPDLALNLEIADLINQKKQNCPRDAAFHIVKLINHRNPAVGLLALTLLDICVKNCGYPFHLQIATTEFLNELVRNFPEKPPVVPNPIQLRILEFIQEWKSTICTTSRHKDDLNHIGDMYRLLLYKGTKNVARRDIFQRYTLTIMILITGYIFPELDNRSAAVLHPTETLKSPDELEEEDRAAQAADPEQKPDYKKQVNEELERIQKKTILLKDMLNNVKPGEEIGKGDVFEDLIQSCKVAQPKIQKFISEEDDPESIERLLNLNDLINTVLKKYEDILNGVFEETEELTPPPPPPPSITSESWLIDLGEDEPQLQGQGRIRISDDLLGDTSAPNDDDAKKGELEQL
ncbi:7057_t:CDS:10 [Acaulospora colombiana]|uniref:7057_t:CDS:1 n=1 Tax=Acaulospora colombiana TaxID=27376 RepID=A0ACA9K6H6_9GLOM|nr:7057_t:CDS:10 [Acaulospora colombiana]